MTRHLPVMGPYATQADALAEPVPTTWDSLPRSVADRGHTSRDLLAGALMAACIDRGVELGGYDRRTLRWLAGFDAAVVQVVIGLISRAYAAGLARGGSSEVGRG